MRPRTPARASASRTYPPSEASRASGGYRGACRSGDMKASGRVSAKRELRSSRKAPRENPNRRSSHDRGVVNPHGTAHYGVGFGIVFQFHVGNSMSNLGSHVLKSVRSHVDAVEEVWSKLPPAEGRGENPPSLNNSQSLQGVNYH